MTDRSLPSGAWRRRRAKRLVEGNRLLVRSAVSGRREVSGIQYPVFPDAEEPLLVNLSEPDTGYQIPDTGYRIRPHPTNRQGGAPLTPTYRLRVKSLHRAAGRYPVSRIPYSLTVRNRSWSTSPIPIPDTGYRIPDTGYRIRPHPTNRQGGAPPKPTPFRRGKPRGSFGRSFCPLGVTVSKPPEGNSDPLRQSRSSVSAGCHRAGARAFTLAAGSPAVRPSSRLRSV